MLAVLSFAHAGVAHGSEIRLKGICDSGNWQIFSLQCNVSGGARWVKVGQPVFGGSIKEYIPEKRSIIFKSQSGLHEVTLEEQSLLPSDFEFKKDLIERAYGTYEVGTKPFSEVPEVIRDNLTGVELVHYLVQEGHEIPGHVVASARSEVATNTSKDEGRQARQENRTDEVSWRPRTPKYITSMTREEKIARRIVGYAGK
ncbi:hypothetical protein [Coraliomargarita sinensis]|uniref:hypothetical protein n=1 Tax=Coraliomargarita sinensis TaxID=2174842 RepID=UPI001E602928|nr:hypothetical protein [Coraliomargarita sinensis]